MFSIHTLFRVLLCFSFENGENFRGVSTGFSSPFSVVFLHFRISMNSHRNPFYEIINFGWWVPPTLKSVPVYFRGLFWQVLIGKLWTTATTHHEATTRYLCRTLKPIAHAAWWVNPFKTREGAWLGVGDGDDDDDDK